MSRPIGLVHDPDAEKRSVMLARKVLCNGERTGVRCAHYWTMIRNEPSHNPDYLTMGGKLRFCRAWGPEPLEFGEGDSELATSGADEPLHRGCTEYRPAGLGSIAELNDLVQIARIPKRTPDGKWETKEEFVYDDSVLERDRYDATYEDPEVYVDANEAKLKEAFDRIPIRSDLTDGTLGREHEEAFALTPGKHDGPAFVEKKVSIDDVLKELPDVPPAPPTTGKLVFVPASKKSRAPKKTVRKSKRSR